jgi:hypothetical protein
MNIQRQLRPEYCRRVRGIVNDVSDRRCSRANSIRRRRNTRTAKLADRHRRASRDINSSLQTQTQHPTSIMRFSTGLLLPVLIGAASAIPDAKVYLFQGEDFPNTSTPPTISPEEARLVFAQRLGISQYHGVGEVSEKALSHINKFGGPQELLFQDSAHDKAAELVLIVEGISSKTAEPLLSAWSSIKPAFTISNPPSSSSNLKLAKELQAQVGTSPTCALEDAINPADRKCWTRKSKIMQVDVAKVRRMSYLRSFSDNDRLESMG